MMSETRPARRCVLAHEKIILFIVSLFDKYSKRSKATFSLVLISCHVSDQCEMSSRRIHQDTIYVKVKSY